MKAKLLFLESSPWRHLKFSLLLLLAIDVTVQAFDAGPFVIPHKSDPPPAVDGQLNEWVNRPGGLNLDRREQVTSGSQVWKSTTDLSARAWLAWRHDVFHFAISVTDDQVRHRSHGGSNSSGDQLKLFLDVTPGDEPSRETLGGGQFQIVFSPGNFSGTGNQGADIAPTVYVNDLKFDGGKIAATQTPDGYDLEGAIPWSHFGVATPSNGMALRFEIAVGDADGDDGRPEKVMTSSTNAWVIQRSRLVPATLGDTSGRAPENTTGQKVFGDLRIESGQSATNAITIPALPTDREAVLTFKARLHFDAPAGNALAVQVRVNGRIVNASRLLNKPQYGKSSDGRMHALAGGERFTAFYAPDFTSADNSAYGIEGVKTSEFELRLSGLLREGSNEVVIVHATPSVKPPLIVVDGRLQFRKVKAGTVAQAGPPTGALETFKPVATHKVAYAVKELPESRLEIELNGERFLVESEFSTPAPSWERGSNKFFGHRREIVKQDETILVRDTFTNLTADNLPLMQRHQARLSTNALKQIWTSGLSPAGLNGSSTSPDNPTTFGTTTKSGLGLLPLNDEFQVHVHNFAADGALGLADRQFVLRPGASYTAEWAIVPVARPDYFDFINAARRLQESNFTIRECLAFLRAGPLTQKWSDKAFTDFGIFKSVTMLCATIDWPMHNGQCPHGTAFQLIDRAHYRKWSDRVHRLLPGVKTSIYFHCFIDVVADGPSLYPDARVLRPNGSQADYGDPRAKIYFPTTTNSFGSAMVKNVDLIFDEISADGVYWDELEYSAYQYHYGEPWDGCSADIDPRTHQITRLKSSVALLSQEWRVALVKKILARGPLVGNSQPHTRTMAQQKFPRFVETGSPGNCTGAQLFSPIALGDHLTERSAEDAYRMMLTVLDYGCLYHWYDDMNVIPAYPTLTEHMYPFTPIELHEGWIVGQERIITKRSGLFGWGDKSHHEVHAYDERGREMKQFKAPLLEREGANFSELRLAEGWSAVVVRK